MVDWRDGSGLDGARESCRVRVESVNLLLWRAHLIDNISPHGLARGHTSAPQPSFREENVGCMRPEGILMFDQYQD